MSEKRALKLRCGAIGRLVLIGARRRPRLSLIWQKREQLRQNILVQPGSLIRHGWTIGFNPKIVVMQQHTHWPAGGVRIEQVFMTPAGACHEREALPTKTRLLRETVLINRATSRTVISPLESERVMAPRPTKRGPELSIVHSLRNAPFASATMVRQHVDIPHLEVSGVSRPKQHRASPLAAILWTARDKMPVAGNLALWPRVRPSHSSLLPNSKSQSARDAAAWSLPMQASRRGLARPLIRRMPTPPSPTVLLDNIVPRAAKVDPTRSLKPRPVSEQVWLKSPESPNQLIEIAAGRHIVQPVRQQASDFQIAASPPPPPHVAVQAQLPDMNRLVDEVLRRIDRVARDERQRRGI